LSAVILSAVGAGPALAHVQPYFTPVPISADALTADPALANFNCWDLRVSVTSPPPAQDRFNVATFDAPLSIGTFYSPVGGSDIQTIPAAPNLSYDTYVTIPSYDPVTNTPKIYVLGRSDILVTTGPPDAIFPRADGQQSQFSVAWGTLGQPAANGDFLIARFTVSKDATGPVAGYVLSNQTNNLQDYNFATLSFNNGALSAAPGSEFALIADANRDNKVNSTDFSALAQHFDQSNSNWANGDFNGDGQVNALDFNAMASNYGVNTQAPALATLVPEPISVLALGAALLMLTRRRVNPT
jgi:hypothetical protein